MCGKTDGSIGIRNCHIVIPLQHKFRSLIYVIRVCTTWRRLGSLKSGFSIKFISIGYNADVSHGDNEAGEDEEKRKRKKQALKESILYCLQVFSKLLFTNNLA